MNQVEIWFSILARRVIKRGNFCSKQDLRTKLLAFIDYFNAILAKPFRWTYTGRPVKAKPAPRPRTWREDWASRREDSQALSLVT